MAHVNAHTFMRVPTLAHTYNTGRPVYSSSADVLMKDLRAFSDNNQNKVYCM